MKLFAVPFAVLFAAAVAAVSAQAPACDLEKLKPLMSDPSFAGCTTESGLTIPPAAVPTAAEIQKACSSKSCAALVAKVTATGLTTCKLGAVDLIKDIFIPIAKECKFDGAAPPAAGNETAPAKPANTPAGSRTAAPKESVEVPKDGSHAGSSKDTIANAPANNGTTPAKPDNSSADSHGGNTKTPAATGIELTPAPTKVSEATIALVVVGSVFALALIGFVAYRCRRSDAKHVDIPEAALSPQPDYRAIFNLQSPPGETTEGVSTQASSGEPKARTTRPPKTERELSSAFCDADVLALRLPLKRLEIGKEVSHGASGRVYTGFCDRQEVAIKRLAPNLCDDKRQILGFLSEAKLMATIHHERIIRFIGIAWTDPSDLMIVTQFMPRGDLRSLLQEYANDSRPTGFNQVKLKIAQHVIEGLAYLHSLSPQVLHRDLKSRNILLSASLDACLTDFGVSRERADTTMTMGVGTLRWMAPEVMFGGRYTDTADVFSFGVVLSELDTHQLPYCFDSHSMPDAAVIALVSNGTLKVSFSPAADKDVVQLARECTALSPTERPNAAEVLKRMQQIFSRYKAPSTF
ncbi:hypothetical protein PINS_up017202 [Pythium insidiosum]|nr:hypothetical protein PINS_up017202 [Pythium insidiosum]